MISTTTTPHPGTVQVLHDLVMQYGMRGVLDSLAMVADKAHTENKSLPYATNLSDGELIKLIDDEDLLIENDDLRVLAENLAHTDFF